MEKLPFSGVFLHNASLYRQSDNRTNEQSRHCIVSLSSRHCIVSLSSRHCIVSLISSTFTVIITFSYLIPILSNPVIMNSVPNTLPLQNFGSRHGDSDCHHRRRRRHRHLPAEAGSAATPTDGGDAFIHGNGMFFMQIYNQRDYLAPFSSMENLQKICPFRKMENFVIISLHHRCQTV